MLRYWRHLRLAVALAVLTAIVGLPVASAQEPNRRGHDRGETVESTFVADPIKRGYTATDDLWTWRDRNNRQTVQTNSITSVLTFLETLEDTDDTFWKPGDSLILEHSMDLDLRYVPDLDSDSSGMAVSGRASGKLSQFIPDVGDEVIVGTSLQWDAKVSGDGRCNGDECEVDFVLTGPLHGERGQNRCGELTVEASSFVYPAQREFGFKSVSGMDSETEVLDLWSANVSLAVAQDGSTCFIGETEKNILSSRVTFYYGEQTDDPQPYRLGEPEVTRVMPGDNVKIMSYRGIPVQLLETLEDIGDTLWDPQAGPLTMMQDMRVELRYTPDRADPNRGTVLLSGDVRGVFPKEWTLPHGLVAEGTIAGRGVCSGPECEIQLLQTFEILQERNQSSCGSMTLAVTVDYVHGNEPQWTFRTEGAGSITLRNHQHCLLDTIESLEDI